VIRNGVVINEYENVPDVPCPGRPNDPGSSSRGLVGYIGLQAHGGPNDVASFRNIRIKDPVEPGLGTHGASTARMCAPCSASQVRVRSARARPPSRHIRPNGSCPFSTAARTTR
jgi:hypothetical protein